MDLFKPFVELLEKFDYAYEYSDDHSVWRRGVAQKNVIEAEVVKHPVLMGILRIYQHYWWRDAPWETKKAERDQALAEYLTSVEGVVH